jgi:hypothetical protein
MSSKLDDWNKDVAYECDRIDDYWDLEDEPLPEDDEHEAELGAQTPPKLPFAFFVDKNIGSMMSLGLPADECIAALRVRFDKSFGTPIHKECMRLSRLTYAPWPPVPNEYGIIPWSCSYRLFLADRYGKYLGCDYPHRLTNAEMWKAGYKISEIQKFAQASSDDRARYKREMEAALALKRKADKESTETPTKRTRKGAKE